MGDENDFFSFIHLVELMLNVFNWALWLKLLVWLCVFVCACVCAYVYVTFFFPVDTYEWTCKMCRFLCKSFPNSVFSGKIRIARPEKNQIVHVFLWQFQFICGRSRTKNKSRTKQPKSEHERMRNIWETIRFRNSRKSCYFLSFISRQSASCTCSAQLWQICILLPLGASRCVQTKHHRPYKMSRAFISLSFNYRRQKTFKHGFD